MNHIRKLTYSALCLALAMVLPFLTGQIPEVGSMLCPMHIPALLCGFLCGPLWGLAVGFASPLLRFVIFSMPPIFPTGLAMAFELAAYGTVSGFMYCRLPKTTGNLYLSLVSAMVVGRILWGIVMVIINGLGSTAFPFSAFFAGAIANAVPGILLQLVLIPALVTALHKAGLATIADK